MRKVSHHGEGVLLVNPLLKPMHMVKLMTILNMVDNSDHMTLAMVNVGMKVLLFYCNTTPATRNTFKSSAILKIAILLALYCVLHNTQYAILMHCL